MAKRNGMLNRIQGPKPQYFRDVLHAVQDQHVAANIGEHGFQTLVSRRYGETPKAALGKCFLQIRRDYEYLEKPKIEGWRVSQLVSDNPLAEVELRLYLSANKEEDDD